MGSATAETRLVAPGYSTLNLFSITAMLQISLQVGNRGGFEVDIEGKGGQLTQATLRTWRSVRVGAPG